MRTLILASAIAATLIPAAAEAQPEPNRHEVRHEVRQEVRQDRREVRQDRREVRQDRRDLRENRRELRRDRRDLQHSRVAYVAPYGGWRYAPVNDGYRLRPGFYGQRYGVSDYNRYNLTAPGRNLRWIRYGNDLLLVNVRNGRVLRVLHNRYYR